ncbi:BOS complex subunit TMEM147-like [Lineus longissimus]|uniref:BOS complex subunit TMEM147-like n=1 Tax=Lineus longissimus TaxID=88925 RepID=UPI002B4E069E
MTLFHFGNCAALAFVPYFIVYRLSGLAEYSAFWKCAQAGTAYLFTQLVKMLILATFFPSFDVPAGSLDVIGEFLKTTVDVIDLVGIHLIMSKIAGKGQLKFMVAGLGWATAELVMTKLFPLWVGARGVEFDWKYVQLSFEANIQLVQHIATAVLVWLYSRHDLNRSRLPVVMSLMGLSCYKPLIVEILIHAMGLGSWTLLLLKAMFTVVVGTSSLVMYLELSQTVNSYY